MSYRSLFSKLFSKLLPKLLSPRSSSNASTHSEALDQSPRRWRYSLVGFFIVIALLLSALWLVLAIWYQFGAVSWITWLATITIMGVLIALLMTKYRTKLAHQINTRLGAQNISNKQLGRWLMGGYALVWLVGLGWYLSIEPKQYRNWQPEVSEVLSYTRDANNPNLVTFYNVRNFDWYLAEQKDSEAADPLAILADERWETRTVDLSKLAGIDVTNSYWMGPLIAHTLVSFRFEDDRPLAFSFEIRKEEHESFSAFAGFFRRFELSLIASEERDILYTRSNARGEQVYLFPISHLQKSEVTALFESYLEAADKLAAAPAWYNTFTSNCTNIIFYMARIVSGERLPWDYRIWVSGWLPNYLFDVGMLDANPEQAGQPWSMDQWYRRTHINPKVAGFDNQFDSQFDKHDSQVNKHSANEALIHNSRAFSKQIRQGLPIPPLADSSLEASKRAKSAASVSND